MGLREAEKEGKKISYRIPFILGQGKKIPKKIAKKFNKLKNLFPALLLAKSGWDRPKKEKKNLVPYSVQTRPGQENSEKKEEKLKKFKNLIPELFLEKTGWERPRKREKKFRIEFRSYSARARKFRKK